MSMHFCKSMTTSITLACIVRSLAGLDFLSIICVFGAVMSASHSILSKLNTTHFKPMSYNELIPTMQMIYSDLINCNLIDLLELTRRAFKFISYDTLIGFIKAIHGQQKSYWQFNHLFSFTRQELFLFSKLFFIEWLMGFENKGMIYLDLQADKKIITNLILQIPRLIWLLLTT